MSIHNVVIAKLSCWQFQWIRQMSTGCQILAKNKYITSTRDLIIQNERLKKMIDIKEQCADIPKHEESSKIFHTNTNPRNMELSGFNKPAGFTTLYEKRNFFNKLNLKITRQHTKAFIENINGDIICYASTTEHYIAKRLHSTTDVCAVVNIAQILAERLKQMGVERVHWFTYQNRTTEKIREFEGILKNNGIVLSELPTRVLQGPSQTLPATRMPRVLPGPLKTAVKRRGTIGRKNKNADFLDNLILDD